MKHGTEREGKRKSLTWYSLSAEKKKKKKVMMKGEDREHSNTKLAMKTAAAFGGDNETMIT